MGYNQTTRRFIADSTNLGAPQLNDALENLNGNSEATSASAPYTGAQQRTLQQRLGDSVNAAEQGALGNGAPVDTLALQKALNTGRSVYLPRASGVYGITNTLTYTAPGQLIWSDSPDTLIQLQLPAATPVVPVLYGAPAYAGCGLRLIGIDHNAAALAPNTVFGANPAGADAVMLMGDFALVHDAQVKNAYGNGIGVSHYDLSGVQTNGMPDSPIISRVRGRNNGCGPRPGIGKLGGTVDILTGVNALVEGVICHGSANSVIVDFAGGAGAVVRSCVSVAAVHDTTQLNTDGSANFDQLSGVPFYFGSGPVMGSGLIAMYPANAGFCLDIYGVGMRLSGCKTYAGAREAFLLLSADAAVTDCEAYFCCLSAGGLPAFVVGSGRTGYPVTNARLRACDAIGPNQAYGLWVNDAAPVTGFDDSSCSWTGTVAAASRGTHGFVARS